MFPSVVDSGGARCTEAEFGSPLIIIIIIIIIIITINNKHMVMMIIIKNYGCSLLIIQFIMSILIRIRNHVHETQLICPVTATQLPPAQPLCTGRSVV